MCRFHIAYYATLTPDDWDDTEEDISYDVRDAQIKEENSRHVVELLKTIRMYSTRDQTHCEDCEPLFVEDQSMRGWCKCTLYSHFVATWRCIPCVLAEEAKLVTSQQKYSVEYNPGYRRDLIHMKVCLPHFQFTYEPALTDVELKTMICGCEKEEADRSTETCRWCGLISSYCYGRSDHHLRRVCEQLGSLTDLQRGDDPVLNQLG
jgi:hypothetical protein